MKTNELRIGNTVMCQCRGEYKPHTIKSIWYNDEEKLYYVELDNGFQCNVCGISPIPLTKEFFEKNGFVEERFYCKVFYSKRINGMILKAYEHSIGWEIHMKHEKSINKFSKWIDYVHEFQNAYYISTGEELEVKLW